MSSITQIETYAKLTPKQKATMLAILHIPSATLANWPCRRYSIVMTIGCGVLMLQVHDDVNVPVRNLLAVESVLINSEQPGHDNACS